MKGSAQDQRKANVLLGTKSDAGYWSAPELFENCFRRPDQSSVETSSQGVKQPFPEIRALLGREVGPCDKVLDRAAVVGETHSGGMVLVYHCECIVGSGIDDIINW